MSLAAMIVAGRVFLQGEVLDVCRRCWALQGERYA